MGEIEIVRKIKGGLVWRVRLEGLIQPNTDHTHNVVIKRQGDQFVSIRMASAGEKENMEKKKNGDERV